MSPRPDANARHSPKCYVSLRRPALSDLSRSCRTPLRCLAQRSTLFRRRGIVALIMIAVTFLQITPAVAPRAHAMPSPEVVYVYDVMVRRHYNFANPEAALDYGHRICDRVSQGEGYGQIMGEVKNEVLPNDEFAANYLVSYAVDQLCPAQIWQLRNSAAGYQPPAPK
ncbi:DUF732 domain-containing protein [Mycobacterium paraintracellulare]|uniref:DUF732 domain-containing protein n=1 Tax=Mycobacterium paraintracellulare TaxID=1138383 RepID=UPI0019353D94|nr:DUF732 domain-containing protein [Mycobacterium paraintracellulare]BCP14220.1 hypothetical protein MINTM021_11290 [Mycobacterium paraintracellulare]